MSLYCHPRYKSADNSYYSNISFNERKKDFLHFNVAAVGGLITVVGLCAIMLSIDIAHIFNTKVESILFPAAATAIFGSILWVITGSRAMRIVVRSEKEDLVRFQPKIELICKN